MFMIAECYTLGPRCALSVLGATLGPGSESRQSPVGPLLNTNTENISEQKIFQNKKYFKTENISKQKIYPDHTCCPKTSESMRNISNC